MNFIKNHSWVLATVALIIAIFALCLNQRVPVAVQTFGAITGETNFNTVAVNGLKVGPTCNDSFGSSACDNQAAQLGGTCSIIGADVTQIGTSTAQYDCAVTGVLSGDAVIGQFASTTVQISSTFGTALDWAITGAKASSTSGFITFTIANRANKTNVLSATNIGSTTNYWVTR